MSENKVERGFLKKHEDVAKQITGESIDGQRMQLGQDVLLYSRFIAIEQGALDRISMSDVTLADEFADNITYPGTVWLGNPEDIREEMHRTVDKVFASIYGHRGLITKEQMKSVQRDEIELDDIVYGEQVENGEEQTEA